MLDDDSPASRCAPESDAENEFSFRVTVGNSAKTKIWKRLEIHEQEFDTLLIPDERITKDGWCYLPGWFFGEARKSEQMEFIDALVYDIDGMQSEAELQAILEHLGVLAWLHTTHTHLKSSSSVKAKHYEVWAEKSGESATPTRESMQRFGVATKKQWGTLNFNSSFELPENGDRNYIIQHDPIPKFRVIFPLATPIVLKNDSFTLVSVEDYKATYHGVGQALGIVYDPACEDPSRLFYFPSYPPNGQPILKKFGSCQKLLDHRDYPKKQKSNASRARGATASTRKSQRQESANKRTLIVKDRDGAEIDLLKWDKKGKFTFDLERAVRASLPGSMIRANRRDGGFHLECPYECDHSEPGGNGTFCSNAANDRPWVMFCSHASCQSAGRRRLDYLAELVRSGYLLVADLENEELGGATSTFMLPTHGGFVVPFGELNTALQQMNERYAVVKLGNKARYVSVKQDGALEFLNKSAFLDYFQATYYLYEDSQGKIKKASFAPAWLGWTGRREYRGYGFYPAPEGHPNACPVGYYNAYRGFSVSPKKGCWKILLGHLYRNVARRNPELFRWLIAWLAQMVQKPHVKPGTHIVMRGKEGVGKSKLGEWLVRLFSPNAMPITSAARLAGRFNAHFETLIFGLVEEAIWAGDKNAEGALKALATAEELDYERKGVDPASGKNYVRLMFASNEDWVVPAASGGRRWCVLEVGDEREKDYQFFAALDKEMQEGGLEAMLHDLLNHDYRGVEVRDAPVTEELVEQRLHSYDTKRRWLREVLVAGGFYIEHGTSAVLEPLNLDQETIVSKELVYNSAREHFGTDRRKAVRSEIAKYLMKALRCCGLREGPRLSDGIERTRTFAFPPLTIMRDEWAKMTGERIIDSGESTEPACNDNVRCSPHHRASAA